MKTLQLPFCNVEFAVTLSGYGCADPLLCCALLEHCWFLVLIGCAEVTSREVCRLRSSLVLGCGWMPGSCCSILIVNVIGVVILLLVRSWCPGGESYVMTAREGFYARFCSLVFDDFLLFIFFCRACIRAGARPTFETLLLRSPYWGWHGRMSCSYFGLVLLAGCDWCFCDEERKDECVLNPLVFGSLSPPQWSFSASWPYTLPL